MIDIMINLAENIVVALLYYSFMSGVLTVRNKLVAISVAVLFIGVAGSLMAEFLPADICILIALPTLLVYTFVFFKSSVKEKVIAFCVFYSTMTMLSLLMYYLCVLMSIENARLLDVLQVALLSVSFIVTQNLISKIWKSIRMLLGRGSFATFFLLPLSQYAFSIFVAYILTESADNTPYFSQVGTNRVFAVVLFAILIVSLMADGLFLNGFAKLATDIQTRERLQALESESELTYEYLKSMEADAVNMRHYRHDILNLLGTVKLAVDGTDEAGREEARRLISQMTQEIGEVSGKKYCEYNLVNCILAHEETKLAKYGVSCVFQAEIDRQPNVSELDMCRIMTNLIDNAGEHCRSLPDAEQRCVYYNMRVIDGYLYMITRNAKSDGELLMTSSKADKSQHGLGLGILRQMTGRSGGELSIAQEGDMVRVTATLRCE